MMDNEQLFAEHDRQRTRWSSQYLNRIGESINFSNITSLQVYNLLERVKDKVASIKTDDDVKNVF